MNSINTATRILIIEDDHTLNHQISALLNDGGYQTVQRFDGRQGLVSALNSAFDLILLDVLLPGLDGFNVLTKLRQKRQTPVMMLTACGAEQERITGYSNGADDYLSKPFNTTELMLRIEAILRRTRHATVLQSQQAVIRTPEFELNRKLSSVSGDGQTLVLTPIEFKLLWSLVSRSGEVLSKPFLYQSVMNKDFSRYDRSLDMHLSRVRRKLTKAGIDASHIATVHGEGYCYQ